MRRYTVAVEDGLDNIRRFLEDEGYKVVDLNDGLTDVDAVVLTGMDENFAGIADIVTDGYVIDAAGRQPEEILYDLEKHFRLMED